MTAQQSSDPFLTAGSGDAGTSRVPGRPLSEADAVDIWIARWFKVRRKEIVARYGCDPRRIYEIWEGTRHPASRAKALELLETQYPGLSHQVDVSCHRRIPMRGRAEGQLGLFD